ncbi:hypothetical protein KSB_31210 [Ktedonobacter robiniae]|uniref:Uncharacterized protein n=1 Tax=Ktedonobacter robiniae TaxID=2778365 RepID=A0ABQ3UPN7_9CHLR|nr:hypothetical protein KSB_31210 [Ktedonobacter robiniae]
MNQQLQAQLKQQEQVLQQLEEQAHALEQALAEHHEPIYTNPLVKALLSEHQREQALAVIEQQGETVPHAPRTEEAHAVTASEQVSARSEARTEEAPPPGNHFNVPLMLPQSPSGTVPYPQFLLLQRRRKQRPPVSALTPPKHRRSLAHP